MDSLDNSQLKDLLKQRESPCISLYLPTHRHYPENQQDPIRFRNQLKELESSLKKKYPARQVQPLLEPFQMLASDGHLWSNNLDGLAVFGGPDFFRFYRLQRPVPELAVAADSFHTKPLLRILQSADRYQILGLSREAVRIFEGNRDVLDELEPTEEIPKTLTEALGEELTEPHQTVASYGKGTGGAPMHHGHGSRAEEADIDMERYFRAVDRAVLNHVSRPSALPLILAALPENHGHFHKLSHNPFLLEEGIKVNPDSLSLEELREHAWKVLLPHYLKRLAQLTEQFEEAKSKGQGSQELSKVAEAAVAGRVATLLIEAERHVPGHLDMTQGEIQLDDLADPGVDDLLDDLGQAVLKMGGEVVIVPGDHMPSPTGIAAIYRF